jgi:poly-gamma-glutamate synthesis protein (capsule biosynthesis protein)
MKSWTTKQSIQGTDCRACFAGSQMHNIMHKSYFQKIFIIFCLILAAATVAIIFANPKSSPPLKNLTTLPAPPPPPTTTIFFAGDIMLSRNVAGHMIDTNDYTLPFIKVADEIKKADIASANLESPFNTTGRYFVENSLVFNADPKSVEGLKLAGFDILATANNHAFDQGQTGLDYTIDWLTSNNILTTGTVHSKLEMPDPIIKHNDILFGFLSYSYTALNDGGKSTSRYIKDFNNLVGLEQDILDMKGHTADVVIVNMHAGIEYKRTPSQSQIDFAHAAIDAGADLVIGHHPHWIQTIEQYKGKYIFYSLGNFVFDQMWSQDTREGLTVLVTYENQEIKKIELKPVIIDDYCCPRWANEEETKNILQKINLTSTIL